MTFQEYLDRYFQEDQRKKALDLPPKEFGALMAEMLCKALKEAVREKLEEMKVKEGAG